ncbi:hypothetical protein WJX74_003033 [Apatococcus lobatus]|uniref:Secreted protein n=1 Tax=Apatococcus lobatus TaxID=904363 RepID=A0AAW1Q7U7_9CHLO
MGRFAFAGFTAFAVIGLRCRFFLLGFVGLAVDVKEYQEQQQSKASSSKIIGHTQEDSWSESHTWQLYNQHG